MMKIHVRHILVEHRYEAEDLLRLLKQGRSFESLAQKFSRCSSAKNGGDLGSVDLEKLDEDFGEAAIALKVGEISPITKTKFGYHLIMRIL